MVAVAAQDLGRIVAAPAQLRGPELEQDRRPVAGEQLAGAAQDHVLGALRVELDEPHAERRIGHVVEADGGNADRRPLAQPGVDAVVAGVLGREGELDHARGAPRGGVDNRHAIGDPVAADVRREQRRVGGARLDREHVPRRADRRGGREGHVADVCPDVDHRVAVRERRNDVLGLVALPAAELLELRSDDAVVAVGVEAADLRVEVHGGREPDLRGDLAGGTAAVGRARWSLRHDAVAGRGAGLRGRSIVVGGREGGEGVREQLRARRGDGRFCLVAHPPVQGDAELVTEAGQGIQRAGHPPGSTRLGAPASVRARAPTSSAASTSLGATPDAPPRGDTSRPCCSA